MKNGFTYAALKEFSCIFSKCCLYLLIQHLISYCDESLIQTQPLQICILTILATISLYMYQYKWHSFFIYREIFVEIIKRRLPIRCYLYRKPVEICMDIPFGQKFRCIVSRGFWSNQIACDFKLLYLKFESGQTRSCKWECFRIGCS